MRKVCRMSLLFGGNIEQVHTYFKINMIKCCRGAALHSITTAIGKYNFHPPLAESLSVSLHIQPQATFSQLLGEAAWATLLSDFPVHTAQSGCRPSTRRHGLSQQEHTIPIKDYHFNAINSHVSSLTQRCFSYLAVIRMMCKFYFDSLYCHLQFYFWGNFNIP